MSGVLRPALFLNRLRLPAALFLAAGLAALLFLWRPALAVAGPAGEIPERVSVLYIEANTGDSSGGHAGLRIGSQVFHYQYGDQGLLVLKREEWSAFRDFYNDLGNRVIYEARLDLPRQTCLKIHDHFTLELLRQDARQARFQQGRAWVELLAAAAAGRPLPCDLRTVGFFDANHTGGRPAAELKKKIAGRLGGDFLTRERRRLLPSLSHLPDSPNSFTTWHEQRSLLAALEILDRELGLDPRSLVTVPAQPSGCGLTRPERERLVEIERGFAETVIKLLQSRRPDRGFPLTLACARYLAVAHSLRENRLLLLNACPETAETIDPLSQAGSLKILQRLADQTRLEVTEKRRRIFSQSGKNNEFFWCRLENAATRYAELQAVAGGKSTMRVYPGNAIPARPGSGWLRQPFTPGPAAARLPEARQALAQLEAEYDRRFGYNLFTRNCVTELFATLSRALDSGAPAVSDSGLGQPEREVINSISFIPWRMFEQVRKGLHPPSVTCYPSLRQRYLAALYQQEPDLLVYLKECNTLTSSLYRSGGQVPLAERGVAGDGRRMEAFSDLFKHAPGDE